jgi:hypothetical protein
MWQNLVCQCPPNPPHPPHPVNPWWAYDTTKGSQGRRWRGDLAGLGRLLASDADEWRLLLTLGSGTAMNGAVPIANILLVRARTAYVQCVLK